jgi:hypothetical protein
MEGHMKKGIKLALAAALLAVPANAYAMPEQVPSRWYSNMWSRLGIMAENPGFCSVFTYVQVCQD